MDILTLAGKLYDLVARRIESGDGLAKAAIIEEFEQTILAAYSADAEHLDERLEFMDERIKALELMTAHPLFFEPAEERAAIGESIFAAVDDLGNLNDPTPSDAENFIGSHTNKIKLTKTDIDILASMGWTSLELLPKAAQSMLAMRKGMPLPLRKNARYWDEVDRLLRREFNIIRIDRPGDLS